jgi:photosystem II stability/assembly factor-like uncharacterized protein
LFLDLAFWNHTMQSLSRRLFPSLCFCVVLLLTGSLRAADEPNKGGPPEFKHIHFRSLGPAAGGRVSRACGVPGDPFTYYAATASGGVWKSSDGGLSWKPVFDEQPIASIGSIAVAPSDPNVIYVGSGEANPRGNVAPGNGVYKSIDAGKTWQHVWKQEGQIGTMIVHPTNPDIAYAAVLGHAFGANPERGVYRTTDGGKTWQRVLFKDADTGASDVCFDPSNPRLLFAGLWQMRRQPWEMTSGGPGSGLYFSRDGGDTWKRIKEKDTGLPEGIYGKIGVAVAPSDPRRVYALIENEKGGLFRSDDGGEKWELVNGGHNLRQRAWYYSTLTVDPSNPDVLWCPQVPMLKSIDGGHTFKVVRGMHHGDNHDLWIDPKNPKRMINSNDGGVNISTNGGETWFAPELPISQFYHVACDNRVPYHVSGCMQDLGSASGPSNSLSFNGIGLADWYDVGGGEAGFTAPDPSDPNVVYAGEYGGLITRYDHRMRQSRAVGIYPADPSGHGGEDLRYRFQWTAPIVISPHDSKTVYHACNVLFKTTDGGNSWKAISGDLTRNDKAKQKWSGGPITGDNTGVEIYCTIFAVAESPKQKDLIWAGSDDGLVHVTTDGGANWTKVSDNMAGLPEWGTVVCIEPSPHEANTAYVVVDAHRLDDMRPYLFKTEDLGKTWKSLSTKLPQDVFLHAVRVDPVKKDMLYVGTERGVVYSTDDGNTWRELKMNLPTVAVHDLVVKGNDLVLGTHGRSIWILDDLTTLREMSPTVAGDDFQLFPTQSAHRYRLFGAYGGRGVNGENPPAGAIIQYHLKKKPKGEITLEILDEKGGRVNKFTGKEEKEKDKKQDDDGDDDQDRGGGDHKKPLPLEVGVNRFIWDLQYEGAKVIKGAKVDSGDAENGPLANPGKYTLKLTVEGKTQTATLEVLLDPRYRTEPLWKALVVGGPSLSSEKVINYGPNDPRPFYQFAQQVELEVDGLARQLTFTLKLRDDINHLTDTVERLRALKKQLTDRNALLKDETKAEPLVKDSKDFLKKLEALEEQLHNPKAEVTYDILAQKGGAKLYSQLVYLYESVKDSDGPPTQGVQEEYAEQARELQKLLDEWKGLLSGDLARLNELAKKLDYPTTYVPPPAEEKHKP